MNEHGEASDPRRSELLYRCLMALSFLILGTMGLYFVGENLHCILGQQITC